MEMQKLPIGIQEFEKLRREGYLYIDKTKLIHQLITRGAYYFLSRPRRFGKSLLMSTIQAIFEGKRELFDGTVGPRLAIADKEDISWEKHPVMHLDLNTDKYDKPEVLTDRLNSFLCQHEALYGARDYERSLGARFEGVIERAYRQTGHRVVILVDEYDKPLLQAIGDRALQSEFRGILKGFYGALKSKDGCIRLGLLSGVTKFGKVSVFSDLNNLNDISMDFAFSTICGISEEELLKQFSNEITALAAANSMTYEQCVATLRARYDGYHFEENAAGVYNPFSVLNTFFRNKFGSYWFETGTPSYLVELLQRYDYNLEEMSHIDADADTLNCIDSESQNPIPIIYQSGYLTIKDYDSEFNVYTLGFPNQEVEEGFVKYLIPCYTQPASNRHPFDIRNYVKDLREGNVQQFVTRLRSLFADTPYELIRDLENHYQNVIWLISKLLNFYVRPEYHTSNGRIDLLIQTPKFCYVMEFKFDGTAEEAIAQISDKGYTLPFELGERQIFRIGMNFSRQTRNVEKVIVV